MTVRNVSDRSGMTTDWIERNPEAAALLLQYAREMASHGRRFGVKLIAERVRYEMALAGSPLKLNNDMTAYIGRWIAEQNPFVGQYMHFRRADG